MAHVLVLAAAAAVYPALLAGVILIVTRPNPVPQLAAFFAGGLAVSVVVGVLILFVLDGTGVARGSEGRTVGPAADLVAAALSFAIAVRLWRPQPPAKPREGDPSWLNRTLARGSVPLAAAVGVILNLPSVWYLVALKDIDQGSYSPGRELFMVLAFNVVMFTLVEAPLIWYLVSPAGAERAVARFDAWFHAHVRRIGAVVAAAVGAYLAVKGVAQL